MARTDKRLLERFELKLPALVHLPVRTNGNGYHLLLTRNVSSGGAYFHTMEPLSCNGQVHVEMLFKVKTSDNQIKYSYVATTGEVVRRDETGIAVRFDDEYTLSPYI